MYHKSRAHIYFVLVIALSDVLQQGSFVETHEGTYKNTGTKRNKYDVQGCASALLKQADELTVVIHVRSIA